MAIKLTTTREAASSHGLKMLIHGPSGAGKTTLAKTTGQPTIIISAEAGLLSLRDTDIPVITVESIDDVTEAYKFIKTEQCSEYKWIILDSVSEIAEVVLSAEKERAKDARQAYGELQDSMLNLMRAFRDMEGKNVVFIAKQAQIVDDEGITKRGPMMPGTKLAQQIPYLFDLVMALRLMRDPDGKVMRQLQTAADIHYEAKDRSGALAQFMPPDLSAVADAILGNLTTNTANAETSKE